MKKFNDYDTTKVNDFGERLKLGGHICKVLEAKVESGTSKKDGKPYEMLVIKFDIEEPDELDFIIKNLLKQQKLTL